MPLGYPNPYGPNTYTPPKPSWATGKTAWDPKGLFGSNPTPGMTQDAAPTYNYSMRANPTASYTADPISQNTQVATAMPNAWAQSPNYIDKGPQNTNVSTPMPGMDSASTGSNGFNTQYATLDNIKPYMTPYLDQIIKNGTNAIEHSAAGRGLFGSSGNVNDIGDWAANQTYRAQNDAFDRFAADRGYMTDNYWKNTQNSQDQYWKNYGANWDQYKYGNADYLQRMMDAYNQNQGVVNAEQAGANKQGDIYSLLGNALAGIYGDQGNAAAAGGIAGSQAQRGMLGNLLGLLAFL